MTGGNCEQSGYFFAPPGKAFSAVPEGAGIHEIQAFVVCIWAELCASRLVKSIEMLHTPAAPMIV